MERQESGKESEKNQEEVLNTTRLDSEWLIRDCGLYKDEYKECTSIRGRFHQYFIFGETADCNQWKRDHDNCCKWVDDKDVKAAESLINSETARRLQRLRGHYRNDIWQKRISPPDDWAQPLPDWMTKRDENTYLAQKAKELGEGKEDQVDKGFCKVM